MRIFFNVLNIYRLACKSLSKCSQRDDNYVCFWRVMAKILQCASAGSFQVCIREYLPDNVVHNLKLLGFYVEREQLNTLPSTLISWDL
jgi:hypothetical protein